MLRPLPHGLFSLLLCLASSGCVLRALAVGGADGKALWTSHDGTTAPTYDCTRGLVPGHGVCRPRGGQLPARALPHASPRPPDPYLSASGKLTMKLPYRGGTLAVFAQPAVRAEHIVLRLRPVRGFSAAPSCIPRLFRDGEPVRIEEFALREGRSLVMAISSASVRGLEQSVRFAGEYCGEPFELDAAARLALSGFEARFREQRASLPTAQR